MKKLIIILFFIIGSSNIALAVNAMTVGTCTAAATDRAISFKCNWTNDDNRNGTVSFAYRVTGQSTWLPAYQPYVDQRPNVGGVANTNHFKEARGSIVGLTAGTSYDLQATYSDPDTLTNPGSSPITTSVTTQNFTKTYSGTTHTATTANYANVLNGSLGAINAGDMVVFSAGTYTFANNAAEIQIVTGGTSANYVLYDFTAAGITLNAAATSEAIIATPNFIEIRGGGTATINHSHNSGITMGNNMTGVIVQGFVMSSISESCAGDPTGGNYFDTGIAMGSGEANFYLFNNSITASTALAGAPCTGSPVYNSPATGINFCGLLDSVIASNTVTGAFRDGISADASGCINEDVDVDSNTVSGVKDDSIEAKGPSINVRLWRNSTVISTLNIGETCWAINTNDQTMTFGPRYVFRNYCKATVTGGGGLTHYKCDTTPQFIFHNSADSSGSPASWDVYSFCSGAWVYNNINVTLNGNINYNGYDPSYACSGDPPGDTMDYNIGHQTGGGNDWSALWTRNGSVCPTQSSSQTNYVLLSDFVTGTSNPQQDGHSLTSDPVFQATFPQILNTSPAANKALDLANFNGNNSLWPFTTIRASIGAFEANPGTRSTSCPPLLMLGVGC